MASVLCLAPCSARVFTFPVWVRALHSICTATFSLLSPSNCGASFPLVSNFKIVYHYLKLWYCLLEWEERFIFFCLLLTCCFVFVLCSAHVEKVLLRQPASSRSDAKSPISLRYPFCALAIIFYYTFIKLI